MLSLFVGVSWIKILVLWAHKPSCRKVVSGFFPELAALHFCFWVEQNCCHNCFRVAESLCIIVKAVSISAFKLTAERWITTWSLKVPGSRFLWSSPGLTMSHQSHVFPSAFRYDVLRHGTGVPLRPRAVVHGHLRVAALVGGQRHMARGHGRTTQDAHGTTGVHTCPDKEVLEFVFRQEVTRRRQEGVEGDVDGARDVAWLCVC